MQAMIFAAGLGTRLRPLTNNKPKALVEINGKTLLERNIEKLLSFGINKIVVNIHHFPEKMRAAIDEIEKKYGCKILISDESKELLNTGGGFLNAKKLFSDTDKLVLNTGETVLNTDKLILNISKTDNDTDFSASSSDSILLHNVDILSDTDFSLMSKEFNKTTPLALLAVKKRDTQRYLIFNENNELCGWTNLKTNERIMTRPCKQENLYAFSGIHIVSKSIFEKITLKGAFSLIDMYLELSKTNIIKAYLDEGLWLDVGKLDAIEKAKEIF